MNNKIKPLNDNASHKNESDIKFETIINEINEEKKKDNCDKVKILLLLYDLFLLFNKERFIDYQGALHTQCVAVFPLIIKKGLELKLSRCDGNYNELHMISGEVNEKGRKTSISIGKIIDDPYSLYTEFSIDRAKTKRTAEWKCVSYKSNLYESVIMGKSTILNKHKRRKDTYGFEHHFYTTIIESKTVHTSDITIPGRNKLVKEEKEHTRPINSSKERDYITSHIANIPALTTVPFEETTIYYLDNKTIMDAFYKFTDLYAYPDENYQKINIDNIIKKGLQGKKIKSNDWTVKILGMKFQDSDLKTVSNTFKYDGKSFKEEGLPIALLLSYLPGREPKEANIIKPFIKDLEKYIPSNIHRFTFTNNVIIDNGENKFNHNLITSYEARSIIRDYLIKKGFEEKQISKFFKEFLSGHIKDYNESIEELYSNANEINEEIIVEDKSSKRR